MALQPHPEITAPTVREWAERKRAFVQRALDEGKAPGVESIEKMLADVDARTRDAHALADRLYDRLTHGFRHR